MTIAGFAPQFGYLSTGRSHDREAGFPLSVIVVSASINILGLALPLVILQVYDRVLANQSMSTLFWLITGLLVVIAVEAGLKIIRSYLLTWFATRVSYLSDTFVAANILSTPAERFEEQSSGAWMEKFDSLQQHNAFASSQSRLALADLPFIALYVGIIYAVAGLLSLAVVIIALLFTIVFAYKIQKLSDILAKRAELDQRRYDFIGETLGGIEAIKSMAMEPQMERRLERLQKQSAAVAFRKNLLSNDLTTTTSFMIGIMMVAVVTIGAMMVLNGNLSVGTLACTTLLVSRLAQLVVRCIPVLMERQTAQFSRERASSLFEPSQETLASGDTQVEVSGRIQIKDVEFGYDDATSPQIVIDELDIQPGEAIGIKGGSSTGKSTLLKILAGELVVQRGTMEIDGHDMHGELKPQLQGQMRFIRNVPQMFRGSILENITMFEKGEVILKAKEMARVIGLDQAVNQLPGGIHTEIGSGASTVLPVGMLQQISVARALTAEPKILLFDEANTALDLRADQILIEQLARLKGRMTRVYITNRPSLLKTADRTFELQNGRLVPLPLAK